MVTMVDEIFDRNYQAGRDELNASHYGRLLAAWLVRLATPSKSSTKSNMRRPGPPRPKRARCN